MNAVRQLIGKVQLRCKLEASSDDCCRANLKVNMHGSNRIPTWVNCEKPYFATGIRHLVPAQKLLATCVETWIFHIRIDPSGIALPNIDLRVWYGSTFSSMEAHYLKRQRQRRTRPHLPISRVSANVGSMQSFVHKIRTLGLFWSDNAERAKCAGNSLCFVWPSTYQQTGTGGTQ